MPCSRALAGALVAGALAGAAGCGPSGGADDVRAVSQRFLAAYQGGQGAAACAALSDDTRTELEREEGKRCAQAIGSVKVEPGAVTRVQVFSGGAKVDLSSGESIFLTDDPGGWRLSAIGCTPEGGKPADEPFDCELEA